MSKPVFATRMWGAVMTEDGPVADVRDVTTREEWEGLLTSDTFRQWAFADLEWFNGEGHTRHRCEPGKPCKKCMATAREWWWEHGRRTRSRRWIAAQAEARGYQGYSSSHWGEPRDDKQAAISDAQSRGWPLVCCLDGHGNRLDWIDVAAARPSIGSLFGGPCEAGGEGVPLRPVVAS